MGIAKSAQMVSQMTDTAHRLDLVRQDPAVRKAGKQALEDSKQAVKSIGEFAVETNASWHRSKTAVEF